MSARTGVPKPLDYQRPERPGRVKELPFTGPVRLIAFAAVGSLLGLVASFALWLIFGGWGPPGLIFFGGLGLFLGVVGSNKPSRQRHEYHGTLTRRGSFIGGVASGSSHAVQVLAVVPHSGQRSGLARRS